MRRNLQVPRHVVRLGRLLWTLLTVSLCYNSSLWVGAHFVYFSVLGGLREDGVLRLGAGLVTSLG